MNIQDSNPIDSTASSITSSSVRGPYASGQASGTTAAGSSSSDDEVSLSSVSQLLRNSSADRASHLATLSGRVQSGQYQVPSALLSQSVVSETLARTGRY